MRVEKAIMSKKLYDKISIVQAIITMLILFIWAGWHWNIAIIPSTSMYPTLKVDSVFVYQTVSAEDFDYGDIVLFFPHADADLSIQNGWDVRRYKHLNGQEIYVKRLIGKPGDVIEFKDNQLYRNGKLLVEDYLQEAMQNNPDCIYTVPENAYYCLGDNRNNSQDSRYYGAFSKQTFCGKLIFYVNPLFKK